MAMTTVKPEIGFDLWNGKIDLKPLLECMQSWMPSRQNVISLTLGSAVLVGLCATGMRAYNVWRRFAVKNLQNVEDERHLLERTIAEECPISTLFPFQHHHLLESLQTIIPSVPLLVLCRLIMGSTQPWYYRILFGEHIIDVEKRDAWTALVYILNGHVKQPVYLFGVVDSTTMALYQRTFHHMVLLLSLTNDDTVITCCAETMRLIIDTMDLHLQPNERTAFLPLDPGTASKLRTVKNPVVHGEIVFQRYEIMRKADVNAT
jgi:hypothetical protein